ncbi:hypothetical protein [Amycolatopsis eburnea]|uniref:Uncharacterized protein n=1 Tax=Amycolatopsis eburnea TaxID=2267691 RepID=A0A427TQA3_9PSEU|nr:hypothetical protein [Amycolatopsis eburnea]RSD26451.1 hypothetical protein EIY87_00250 [Amycolatopsis eburnea]
MAKDDEYPDGGGSVPGGEQRTRRRGSLPGADDKPAPPPLSTTPAAGGDGDLEMTEKQQLANAKVWGLRISEAHYDTGRTMTSVLGARYKLDQRQVGELIVQFLVEHRFALDEYVAKQAGPAVDLDFFTRPRG